MIIYPLAVLYFGSIIYCLYMAWFQAEAFEMKIVRFENATDKWGGRFCSSLFMVSLIGVTYSWYQH